MATAAMNPGPVEEVGKATGAFMTVMKDQPLSLALCVMNVLLLALFFYIFKIANAQRDTQFALTLQAQKEVQQLLFRCAPIQGSGDYKLQSDESRPVELPPLPTPKPDEAKE